MSRNSDGSKGTGCSCGSRSFPGYMRAPRKVNRYKDRRLARLCTAYEAIKCRAGIDSVICRYHQWDWIPESMSLEPLLYHSIVVGHKWRACLGIGVPVPCHRHVPRLRKWNIVGESQNMYCACRKEENPTISRYVTSWLTVDYDMHSEPLISTAEAPLNE